MSAHRREVIVCVDDEEGVLRVLRAQLGTRFGHECQILTARSLSRDFPENDKELMMPRPAHFEIPAENPERAIAFYKDVFGWNFQKWDGPMPYWMITGLGQRQRRPTDFAYGAARMSPALQRVRDEPGSTVLLRLLLLVFFLSHGV